MTVFLPEIRSVAGTGRCVWKYLHVHRGERAHTSTCTCVSAHFHGGAGGVHAGLDLAGNQLGSCYDG